MGGYILKRVSRAWKHCEDYLERPSTHHEARRGKVKRSWSTKLTGLLAFNAVAMQAATDLRNEHSATFDTDSGLIGVDNRCS
eukprot:scaffold250072_cov30-Attheya_sp.AAC.1